MNETLIEVKDLSKKYPIQRGFWSKTVGYIHALNNVSLEIKRGEILGIVGESGCGKSTLGKALIKLIDISSGEVFYRGKNIISYSEKELRSLRQNLQIVFQNPYSSLSPRMKIGEIVAEPLVVHKVYKNKNELNNRVIELLEIVGLDESFRSKFPHQLSGGQRQRIAIARALSLNPEFLILDEPVSALDVSVQAQILNLLLDLHKKFNLTYLFISHNLSVVSYISTEVAVMYMGSIVEKGLKEDIINNPQHPYTKALLSAEPQIKKNNLESHSKRIILSGDLPNPSNLPSGCVFRTRCPIAKKQCAEKIPDLEIKTKQAVACFYIGEDCNYSG